MKYNFSNMISNIKNGQLSKKSVVYQRKTKICESILKILWDEGFIIGYKTSTKNNNNYKIFLKYFKDGKPTITNIKLISKPSRRIYYSIKQIWKFNSKKNIIIFSTNKGLKTIKNCKKLKIGGEPLLIIN